MIYLLLVYKPSLCFIWGHALAHLWSPVDASYRRSAYFVLRLLAQTLSGLVSKSASPPIFILICLSWLAYSLCWDFLQIFVSNALALRENIEDSALLFRFPLSVFMSDLFRRRTQSFRQLWSLFSRNLVGSSVRYSRHSPLLSMGYGFSDRLSSGVSAGSWSSLSSLFSRGVSKFLGRTVSWLRAMLLLILTTNP